MDIAKDIVITADNLASIKFWIMQEMQKLEDERDELETEQIELELKKDKFAAEKRRYDEERLKLEAALKKREASADLEKKSLAYQKNLMERKLAILENGFDELNRDKQSLEREKEEFNVLKANLYADTSKRTHDDVGLLFHGVDNILALKKRYRDLLKIFHPDNLDGDNEAVQIINEEYAMLKEYY